MPNNLLITGKPGIGKSTIVKKLCQKYWASAGGVVTKEILRGGQRCGFTAVRLNSGGQERMLAHVDLDSPIRVGRYGVDADVVENFVVPSLRQALKSSRLVVIDEIGLMQITSSSYREVVMEALVSTRPVLATIRADTDPFSDQIKARHDIFLHEITAENRDQLYKSLEEYLRVFLYGRGTLVL